MTALHSKRLWVGLVVGLCCWGAPVGAQDLVLQDVRVVDPSTKQVEHGDLWVRGGRVAGFAAHAPSDAPGRRIDLGGRWLIPGLSDLHTHSFGNSAPGGITDGWGTSGTAERVVRAGVTRFLDLFGAEDYVLGLRDRQEEGQLARAELLAAGPCFTATGGHCSEYGIPTRLVDSPADARRELAELAPKVPDVVKLVYDHFDYGTRSLPSMDRATMVALVRAASERGLRTVVHVGTWEDVEHSALAGATAVTHVARDGVVDPGLASLIAAREVFYIPTLVVHADLAEHLDDPALLDEPLLAALASEDIRDAYRKGAGALDARASAWLQSQRDQRADVMESVRRLHEAGVRLLTGTDAGNWGVFQGYSVHREMGLLVEAGLSPWEALAASTTDAGAFLGRSLGMHPGDEASFVVLDASPIVRIANTQAIHMVVREGRIVWEEG